jgi:hypothetical protein
MKEKHILNIGLAKCGTSWLWVQLKQHPDVCFDGLEKEPPYFLENNDLDAYKQSFEKFDISANFHVSTWQIDQCLIQSLDSFSTYVSIIFSDPYLFIERFYNWLPMDMSQSAFIDMCINAKKICYNEIADRWSRNLAKSKFKILIYDDLVNNPDKFLSDYFNFCGLRDVTIPAAKKIINKNPQTKIPLTFSNKQIDLINTEISKFEKLVRRDLIHWKK